MNHLNPHKASFQRPDGITDPLYVITTVFNPHRYRSRWKLYKNFEKQILDSGAHLITVEASFGNRNEVFVEQKSERLKVIHVRTTHEIWIKENLINLAVQFLPQDWQYMAWIDADIHFVRPDWVGECIHQLQHHPLIQMFGLAMDVDVNYMPIGISYGFVYDYLNGVPDHDCYSGKKWKKANHWHTGYAWACTKQAFSDLGGLIDWAILGSADNHMARCLIGQWEKSVNGGVSQEYKNMLANWQDRAEKYIKRNLGYMEGAIIHYFHGAKKLRRYKDRWQILVNNNYTPSLDIKRDWNGVYQLTDRSFTLRDQCKAYFKQRNEDSIDSDGAKPLGQ